MGLSDFFKPHPPGHFERQRDYDAKTAKKEAKREAEAARRGKPFRRSGLTEKTLLNKDFSAEVYRKSDAELMQESRHLQQQRDKNSFSMDVSAGLGYGKLGLATATSGGAPAVPVVGAALFYSKAAKQAKLGNQLHRVEQELEYRREKGCLERRQKLRDLENAPPNDNGAENRRRVLRNAAVGEGASQYYSHTDTADTLRQVHNFRQARELASDWWGPS